MVAEVNQGGDMVESVLRQVDPSVSYGSVRASRGKAARAEPVSALYERGLVRHVGALAELEAALRAGDLMALAARFEAGRLSAREAIAVIGAGLRGAGHEITDTEVARLPIDGGAAGYVRLVADLLEATFGGPSGTAADTADEGTGENPTGPGQSPG